HIDHALAITVSLSRSGLIACPATHTDGPSTDPNSIPEAARIQLDPAFNVDGQSWPQWQKVIAHALQTYGAYIYDTGGSMAVAGPEHNRVNHQSQLVDEIVLHQRVQELEARREYDLPV